MRSTPMRTASHGSSGSSGVNNSDGIVGGLNHHAVSNGNTGHHLHRLDTDGLRRNDIPVGAGSVFTASDDGDRVDVVGGRCSRGGDEENGSAERHRVRRKGRRTTWGSWCDPSSCLFCRRDGTLPGPEDAKTKKKRRRANKHLPRTIVDVDPKFVVVSMAVVMLYTFLTLVMYAKISSDRHAFKPSTSLLIVPLTTKLLRKMRNNSNNNASIQNQRLQQQAQHQVGVHTEEERQQAIDELRHTFPIHVGTKEDDTEVIDHPGLALVTHEKRVPEGLERTLTVPKFYDDSYGSYYNLNDENKKKDNNVDHDVTVRRYLGDGGKRTMTKEEAASVGSYDPVSNQETIYCSIATYRDPECTGTIEDLYAMAKYPTRIRVAIIDQHVISSENDKENEHELQHNATVDGSGSGSGSGDPICSVPAKPCEEDPEQALCKYRHLIDVYTMNAELSVGPVFARHLAHRHYRGEYFAMQIDSHVRFVRDWDDDIVGQWKSANNEMAVLTSYPSDINGSIDPVTHAGQHFGRPIMCVSDYEGQGQYKHLRHGQQPESKPSVVGQPTLEPFWAAGFSFARGHFVVQVPYDQYLPMVFQGEEISIGLRGFTYGYDYYAPERSVCFHMYAIKENAERRKKVPLFWEHSSTYKGVGMKAMKRLNKVIGMYGSVVKEDDEWQKDELERYGLGTIRTKEKFFRTFGIHADTQTVEHHLCRLVGRPIMEVFMPAMRDDRMGIDYDKIDYVFVDQWPNQTTELITGD